MDHRPVRNGPTLSIARGASQVADISKATDTVRMRPIEVEENPTYKR